MEKKAIYQKIKEIMPYARPFLFVDEFLEITNEGARGTYTYKEDEFFYQGHFPGNPITPGAIMIETMAQIGLVGLGIYINKSYEKDELEKFVFVSSEVQFFKKVLPGEKVTAVSEKIYFRFRRLKCKVELLNEAGEMVCKGTMSGLVLKEEDIIKAQNKMV